jgi:cyclomaltodextrinase / maltogenic alpha-amylase / neopullulanase
MSDSETNHLDDPRYQPQPYSKVKNAEWSKNATIYEVNVRQFTPEGTFRAFMKHLPRLKDLGIDIIWLMPIHPIGSKNRKGTLGSYYAVKDYYEVNSEFGNKDDFRELVNAAHEQGMYVIIDWVANHTAADNILVDEHPEWYSLTTQGELQPTPWFDWDDVLDLDYDNPGLRKYMTEVMLYWIREFDIDGFRADVAGFVPLEFWENLREEMEAIKPVFMLAEWEERDLHRKAFDMTYAWSLWERLHNATAGGKGIGMLVSYLGGDVNTFPREAYRMNFTDNHDKNSWDGTSREVFGDGLETAIAFTFTINGMPLIYSGQEAGLDRRLPFFEKDVIEWKHHPHGELFRKLIALKKRNQAIWNGQWGGVMIRIDNDQPEKVISFVREKNGDLVLALFNFSSEEINVTLDLKHYAGNYHDVIKGNEKVLTPASLLKLPPWGFQVLEWTGEM